MQTAALSGPVFALFAHSTSTSYLDRFATLNAGQHPGAALRGVRRALMRTDDVSTAVRHVPRLAKVLVHILSSQPPLRQRALSVIAAISNASAYVRGVLLEAGVEEAIAVTLIDEAREARELANKAALIKKLEHARGRHRSDTVCAACVKLFVHCLCGLSVGCMVHAEQSGGAH